MILTTSGLWLFLGSEKTAYTVSITLHFLKNIQRARKQNVSICEVYVVGI